MAKPWADTPFSLLLIPGTPGAPTCTNPGILTVCIEMANVHNILLRSLNSIYLQAPHISTTTTNNSTDVADLMTYITAWTDAVHHHHSLEETLFFPRVEELAREVGLEGGLMSGNVEQHHLFGDGVREMGVYARDVLEGRKGFDSGVLRRVVDGFAGCLTQHLHDEIDTLIKLDKCDGEKVMKALTEIAEEGTKTSDPNLVMPLVFGSTDKGYPGSEHFPPVPFFLPWLNAYWFARKHQGCWRFNPSDHWGRPRPLLFL